MGIKDKFSKAAYFADGLSRRFVSRPKCKCCGSSNIITADRKFPHKLIECLGCGVKFRFPAEPDQAMSRFYQNSYEQSGLTTDLPDKSTLEKLIKQNFRNTNKDFSRFIDTITWLKGRENLSVLDFGANWGYAVFQLRNAGFDAVGFEISVPRAKFSEELGVQVFSDWEKVKSLAPYDVILSSHVLEHTPNPRMALKNAKQLLAEDGVMIHAFPDGSRHYMEVNYSSFHRLWGQVHPFMLTAEFMRSSLPGGFVYSAAGDEKPVEKLKGWNRRQHMDAGGATGELFTVWVPDA